MSNNTQTLTPTERANYLINLFNHGGEGNINGQRHVEELLDEIEHIPFADNGYAQHKINYWEEVLKEILKMNNHKNTQLVDFSNPNADKITSASTQAPMTNNKQSSIQKFWDKIALKLSVDQINEFLPLVEQAKEKHEHEMCVFADEYAFYVLEQSKSGIKGAMVSMCAWTFYQNRRQ